MRYYDDEEKKLVYIEGAATPEFWDRQWEDEKLKKSILSGAREQFVFPATRKYLKPGTKILEGGCGKGQFVYSLQKRGYDAYGIDYAEKTIRKARELVPDLKLSIGDVRKLPFSNNSFDGYWSIGVIEHFFGGFDSIAQEMFRVLKPGGYLFLTFPHLSPLRQLKAALHRYPPFDKDRINHEHFYQFALFAPNVIKKFENFGFTPVQKTPYDGFKGLKDESGPFKPFFQRLYNNKSLFGKITSFCISFLFTPIASHAVLLVFRKKSL